MRINTATPCLPLLLLALTACDTPTAPLGFPDTPLDAAPSEALPGTGDTELADALIAEAGLVLGSSPRITSTQEVSQAASLLAFSTTALEAGDVEAAEALDAQARALVGRAMVRERGAASVEELLLRAETLREALDGEPGEFGRVARIRMAVDQLLARAREQVREEDTAGAAGTLIQAGQLADGGALVGDPDRDGQAGRARYQVARAETALALATRQLEAGPVAESQARLLERTGEMARRANAALENGRARLAFALARRAEVTALMAVVDVDGISEEEVRNLHELAQDLLRQARAVEDPTESQARLIALAASQLEAGERRFEAGSVRGAGLFWRSAVSSSLALG